MYDILQSSHLQSSFYLTDANQEKIVEEGGLDALLLLLETSKDTTIHRVTAGAIANLAMNGIFQMNAYNMACIFTASRNSYRERMPLFEISQCFEVPKS